MERSIEAKFDQLYKMHVAAVQRCVASLGLPRHVWPDILQDVWITVAGRLDEVIGHPRPAGWLCTAVRNHAMHHVRGHLRRQRKDQAVAVEPAEDVADPFRERDAWDTLNRLLADCPLEQREVYLKIELHGMTPGEVAEELGISINTVHSRLRLIRKRLRESSAALAALLLMLREALAREGLGGLPAVSSEAMFAAASAAQRVRAGGGAGKAALLALLIVPASDLQHVVAVEVERPRAAPLAEPSASLESVHTRVLHVPSVEPRTIGAAASSAPAAPAVETSQRLRRERRRAAEGAQVSQLAPLDDGEGLMIAAEKAYRERRFETAMKFALQHREFHPASELRDSREILVARALCQLGRDAEAREQVRVFARESPAERAFRAGLGQLRSGCR